MLFKVTTQYKSQCGDINLGIRRFQILNNLAVVLISRYHKADGLHLNCYFVF